MPTDTSPPLDTAALLAQREAALLAPFEALTNWDDRYQHLIKLGKAHPAINPAYQIETYRVKGCQSQVWMHAELSPEGLVTYHTDSDALIVRGLVALVTTYYNGLPPQVIVSTPPAIIDKLNLSEHLSMQRNNGLAAMLKQLKLYAMAFYIKQQQAAQRS
jgi:cysteine desulfuration protein SufE